MSGQDSSSEKTEEPTPKKLRDSRDEGQVAYSKDFSNTTTFLVVFAYLLINGSTLFQHIGSWFVTVIRVMNEPFYEIVLPLVKTLFKDALILFIPIVMLAFIFAIVADVTQVGLHFAVKAMKLKFDKFNPATNLKNIFSMKSVFELLKNVAKILIISSLVFYLIKSNLPLFIKIPYVGNIATFGQVFASVLRDFVVAITFMFIIIAIIDFLYQKRKLHKDLMMTMEEVKKEMKETEGDPHIKGKRKEIHRSLLSEGAPAKTKNATAVVTNPTHLAVALFYKKDVVPLPIVLAKGQGALAEEMVRVARSEGIPVIQNIFLARSMMRRVDENQYIPSDLIEPVAQIIQWAEHLRRQRRGRALLDEDQ